MPTQAGWRLLGHNTPMLRAGTLVDDKFEVLEVISRGAFGVIYKAKHLGFNRFVALKVLLVPEPELQDEFFRRFEREAQMLSELQHLNLPTIHGYGSYQGSPYMAMGLIEGEDLELVLNRVGTLTFHEATTVLKQVGAGLLFVHNHGIIHRDLKPGNIMLCPPKNSPVVKIIDFGLAKHSLEYQKLTQTGIAVGTTEYMSPEQCMGQPADHRSDIYALGCILHHCLAGKPPFEGENDVAIMRQQVNGTPPRLAKIADVPREVQYVVDKAMAKRPEDRYQSVSEFVADIEAIDNGSSAVFAHGAPRPGAGLHFDRQFFQNLVLLFAVVFSGALGVGLSFYFLGNNDHHSGTAISSRDYYNQLANLNTKKADAALLERARKIGEAALTLNESDQLLDASQVAEVCRRTAWLCAATDRYSEQMDLAHRSIESYTKTARPGGQLGEACRLYIDACVKLKCPQEAWPVIQTAVDKTGHCHDLLAMAYILAGKKQQAADELKTDEGAHNLVVVNMYKEKFGSAGEN